MSNCPDCKITGEALGDGIYICREPGCIVNEFADGEVIDEKVK